MIKNKYRTHHIEQERLAQMRGARAGKRIADGNRFREVPSGNQVLYCSACSGPVVNSDQARRRHAQKSIDCRRAMGL